MKKGSKFLALILGSAMALSLGACKDKNPVSDYDITDIAGTYEITVWNSEVEGVSDLTQAQIDRFNSENELGIVIKATIEGVPEGEAATSMITSVEDGADLYFFAQDQTMRLMQAGALSKLGNATTAEVKKRNGAAGISAATVGDSLYCYPLTEDNGYFMYYDKSVVSADHIDSLEDVIADCEAAGKFFSYELEGSAWYNAGFFFATGCNSVWNLDDDGNFVSVTDNFNSDAGLIALKGMQKVLKSSAYNNSSTGDDFTAATPSAVVISGTWDSGKVKEALGENYGVADLPSFTVDGKSYHLGSYSGSKLLGLKPQTDTKRAAALQQLALYLTNDTCQLERFENFGWGPSNTNAKNNSKVKADPALAALAQQNNYAVAQGQIHGSWWDIAKVYATSAKVATTDDELRAALATYETSVNGLFSLPEEVRNAWTVIGGIGGSTWDKDFEMEEISAGVWKSKDSFELEAGAEFKCRKGLSWDEAFPAENYVVETAGTYYIQIDTTNGTITLIAA